MLLYPGRYGPHLLKTFFTIALAATVLGQNPPAQQLSLEKVRDDLYVVTGDGGNTTIYLTNEGAILVDTKFERNYTDLIAKIKSVTDKPVRYVFNTHAHLDHTEANARFSGTTIIAQRNARTAMVAAQQSGLPQITFLNEITVTLGGKEADAYYFGRAHTNGDAWIYFPALKILASGDSFNNGLGTGGTGGYYGMAINYQNGGSIVDLPKTLDEVLKLDFDAVIPGHGPVASRAQFLKWRTEVEAVGKRIRQMVREGKSKDDVRKMLIAEFAWDPNGQIIPRSLDGLMD